MVRDVAAHRRRAVPILEVAGGVAAVRWLNIQRVVVVDVAGRARSGRGRHVHAGQCKASHAVIEGSQIGPRDSVVTIRAIRSGEGGSSGRMHWIIGAVPIRLMTELVSAGGRSGGQVVTAGGRGMALRALHTGVRIGEREPGGRMIKGGVRPTGGVVAGGALRHRKARGDVIGDAAAEGLRTVPIFEVARGVAAVGGLNGQRVVVVDVAGRAGSGGGRDVHAG